MGKQETIPATLLKPDGDGPFPAIVMAHGCSGLGVRSTGWPYRWGREMVAQGYVVVIPDSFSTRGFPDGVCSSASKLRNTVNGPARASDMYGALAALRALPYVDGQRIGLMGASHGGWTTLSAMYVPLDSNTALAQAKKDGFAAAIAFYPSCSPRYGTWSTSRPGPVGPVTAYSGVYQAIAPLLILTGEKDDWTPAIPCSQLAERSREAGYPVAIKIYPGAHHGFDSDSRVRYAASVNNTNMPSGYGATIGGDATAWADARKEVSAFFGKHLKR